MTQGLLVETEKISMKSLFWQGKNTSYSTIELLLHFTRILVVICSIKQLSSSFFANYLENLKVPK